MDQGVARVRRLRAGVCGLIFSVALATLLGAAEVHAQAPAVMTADIPAQPLADALVAYARQSGLQLIYVAALTAGHSSRGAHGGLSPVETLTQLLAGSGLTFEFINPRTVQIFRVPPTPAAPVPTRAASASRHSATAAGPAAMVVITGARQGGNPEAEAEVQNVAAAVTILEGARLETLRLDQLTDYAAYLPGFSYDTAATPGNLILIVRGIAAQTDATSTVVYLDDTPLGATGDWANACCNPLDLAPFDLERLELLRGPQGTHDGAASEAGVLRYVLREPDTGRFEARIGADLTTIHGTSKSGTALRALVNAPLVDDQLAVRINLYDNYTPGYIDNVRTGAMDVNAVRRYGGRIASLWQANGSLIVKITAFWNRTAANSTSEQSATGMEEVPNTGDAYVVKATRSYGDLVEDRAFLQPWKQDLDYYAATVRWTRDSFEIHSAAAWSRTENDYSIDYSELWGTAFPELSGGTVPAGLALKERQVGLEKFTEELGIASPPGKHLQWLLGAFYNHERATDWSAWSAFDTAYRPIAPPAGLDPPQNIVSRFEEGALYGEITLQLSAAFDVMGGIRYDHVHQIFTVLISGAAVDGSRDSEAATTWSAATRYHVTPDALLYARVATGSQPASLNGVDFPTSRPERLISYEAGIKSEWPEHTALLNVSVFDIDWREIQLFGSGGAVANGGDAESRGLELLSSYSPLPGLKLGYVAAYTQSQFTKLLPVASPLLTGYQLPQVPKWSMIFSGAYDWLLTDAWHAELGGGLRWIDREWGVLVSSRSLGGGPTIEKPSYSVLDLHAGITKDRIAIRLFVHNVADTRATLHNNVLVDNSGTPVQSGSLIVQPRTIGVGFDYSL